LVGVDPEAQMTLDEEAARLNELLVGARVARIARHRPTEIMIEFEGGARLFVNVDAQHALDFSVTS
jgi:hypothetical protein